MAIDLTTTVGVIVLFLVFSVLYKNNVFFRIGSMLFVATTMGYQTMTALSNIWLTNVMPLSRGDYQRIIPIALGLLLFLVYYKKLAFIARYPTAIIIGMGLGSAFGGLLITSIYTQLAATATITDFNSLVTTILVLVLMVYFLQTFRKTKFGPVGIISTVGRLALMLWLGIGLGSYAVARFSHVVGRVEYVIINWLAIR